MGGGIYISEKSTVRITDSFFLKSNVTAQAGALLIESDSLVNITNVVFEKLYSTEASSVMTVNEAKVNIEEGRFYDNIAKVGLMQQSSSIVNITDSYFIDNYGYEVTNGFVLTESDLFLNRTQISNRRKPYYTYDDIWLENGGAVS